DTPAAPATPSDGSIQVCPGNMKYQTKFPNPGGADIWPISGVGKAVYCAMGQWMKFDIPPGYAETSTIAVTCTSP
ncbi:hypothetical protein PMAYCL1PPCAC_20481, partial [Pristionchus mayeri]